MKSIIRFMIIINMMVCCLFSNSAEYQLTRNMSRFINNMWLLHWKSFCQECPMLDPKFLTANISINMKDLESQDQLVFLIDGNGRQLGTLTASYDGNKVGSFNLYYTYDTTTLGFNDNSDIDYYHAEKIVESFIKYYASDQKGEVLYLSEHIMENGRFKFIVEYRIKDINVRIIEVSVDYKGKVVEMNDSYNYTPGFLKRIGLFCDSPGEDYVKNEMTKYLIEHNIKDSILLQLYRTIADVNNKPVYQWRAFAFNQVNGKIKHGGTEIVYDELNHQCRIGELSNPELLPSDFFGSEAASQRPVAKPAVDDTAPTWSADGKLIWFVTDRKCVGYPQWMHYSSMASVYTGHNIVEEYRPLIDTRSSMSQYKYPSPSPDGRWLACAIGFGTNEEIAIDLKNNRLYEIGETNGRGPISWDGDGKRICLIDRRSMVRIMSVVDADGMPFALNAIPLAFPGRFDSVSFLPNSVNELIAVYRDRVNDPNKLPPWQLIRIKLPNGEKPSSEVICDLAPGNTDQAVYAMHPMPDGKHVMLSLHTGVNIIDLETKVLIPVTWLQAGAKINGFQAAIVPSRFDWDISRDGKNIVFSAVECDDQPSYIQHAAHIYVAKLDGKDIEQLANLPADMPAGRYYLQEKYPVVPKSSIPVSLFEFMHMIPATEWIPLPMSKYQPRINKLP